MLKAIIPGTHANAVETFVEEQTIMTCETGVTDTGDVVIVNHTGDAPEQFYAFVEELLMHLPFGTEVRISKFYR